MLGERFGGQELRRSWTNKSQLHGLMASFTDSSSRVNMLKKLSMHTVWEYRLMLLLTTFRSGATEPNCVQWLEDKHKHGNKRRTLGIS